MNVCLFADKERGLKCFEAILQSSHRIVGVVTVPHGVDSVNAEMVQLAKRHDIPAIAPSDPHEASTLDLVDTAKPDILVLAGYGKMLRPHLFERPPRGSINLHAGPLPDYRGAAPINWMILRGEETIGISIIQVASGVDTGDILASSSLSITAQDTATTIATKVNAVYPPLLVELLDALEQGRETRIPQRPEDGFQMTRRYPRDGLILWDRMTAMEIHQLVRALSPPYPPAFTYSGNRRIDLLETAVPVRSYHGVAGRVAAHLRSGVIVVAADRGILIRQAASNGNEALDAIFPPTGQDLLTTANFIERQMKALAE